MKRFAKEPFEEHYSHPSWRYFTNKDKATQRIDILDKGRVDFTASFREDDFGYTLQPFELVDMYCYYYMQMHYASSWGIFNHLQGAIAKYFQKDKDLLFVDLGCGPMSTGAAFIDAIDTSERSLEMSYVGFDNSEDMLSKAEQVAEWVKLRVPKSTFNFTTSEHRVDELIEEFKKNKRNERSAVIINLCYVTAAYYFDEEENLDKFANMISSICSHFESQSICIIYQNPVHQPFHKNWNKLKNKLQVQGFGNLRYRAGIINFTFEDVVGSWENRKTPTRSAHFEFYFNENI
jgi:hypothetical protein